MPAPKRKDLDAALRLAEPNIKEVVPPEPATRLVQAPELGPRQVATEELPKSPEKKSGNQDQGDAELLQAQSEAHENRRAAAIREGGDRIGAAFAQMPTRDKYFQQLREEASLPVDELLQRRRAAQQQAMGAATLAHTNASTAVLEQKPELDRQAMGQKTLEEKRKQEKDAKDALAKAAELERQGKRDEAMDWYHKAMVGLGYAKLREGTQAKADARQEKTDAKGEADLQKQHEHLQKEAAGGERVFSLLDQLDQQHDPEKGIVGLGPRAGRVPDEAFGAGQTYAPRVTGALTGIDPKDFQRAAENRGALTQLRTMTEKAMGLGARGMSSPQIQELYKQALQTFQSGSPQQQKAAIKTLRGIWDSHYSELENTYPKAIEDIRANNPSAYGGAFARKKAGGTGGAVSVKEERTLDDGRTIQMMSDGTKRIKQ